MPHDKSQEPPPETPPHDASGEAANPPLDPQTITPDQLRIAAAATVAGPKQTVGVLSRATSKDLKFIDSLQRKFGRSLGFLPTAALVANLEQSNVDLAMENEEPAGYLLCRPRLSWQPLLASIVQAAVAMDAQRRHHGLALLLQVEERARAAGQVGIQANCAVGVEANEFWAAAGFKPIAHLTPATKSGREIICWRKPLVRKLPGWFTALPAKAGGRSLGVTSQRNVNRDSKSLNFATRFVAGKVLTAGDPNHITNGYYKSVSELQKGQATDGSNTTNQ